MKSFTDIEQSKKLAEILPIESADMYYQYVLPKSDKIRYNPILGNPIDALEWYNKGYTHFGKSPLTLNEYCIPCWSFAALIEQLPNDLVINGCHAVLWIGKKQVCYYSRDDDTSVFEYLSKGDNLLDAVVEMIIKLKEDNLI
jgi:hypothetical protein